MVSKRWRRCDASISLLTVGNTSYGAFSEPLEPLRRHSIDPFWEYDRCGFRRRRHRTVQDE